MEKIKEWLDKNKYLFILSVVSLVLILFSVTFVLYFKQEDEPPAEDLIEELIAEDIKEEAEETNEEEEENTEKIESTKDILVDVKGAVHSPGVYSMKENSRVIDAVEEAGGFLKEAEQNSINLAQAVEDQMLIYVPKEGEEIPDLTSFNQIQPNEQTTDQQTEKINLNEADKDVLMTLSGIGEVKANNILAYREENGPFKAIEEIMEVSGIGEATFENLKEMIEVTP